MSLPMSKSPPDAAKDVPLFARGFAPMYDAVNDCLPGGDRSIIMSNCAKPRLDPHDLLLAGVPRVVANLG